MNLFFNKIYFLKQITINFAKFLVAFLLLLILFLKKIK